MSQGTRPQPAIDDQFAELLGGLSAALSSGSLDDEMVRARLVELERVVNQAQAAQASLMSEMAMRAGIAEAEFVSDEIAIVLHTSKPVASSRLALALDAAAHPVVQRAWLPEASTRVRRR